MPHFCVSIAQMDGNEPIHAVIYDPLRNELFTATRGGGAQLNEKKIRVSERLDLERSEEHTSELQSLMRISYAVFCLKKKKEKKTTNTEQYTNTQTTTITPI